MLLQIKPCCRVCSWLDKFTWAPSRRWRRLTRLNSQWRQLQELAGQAALVAELEFTSAGQAVERRLENRTTLAVMESTGMLVDVISPVTRGDRPGIEVCEWLLSIIPDWAFSATGRSTMTIMSFISFHCVVVSFCHVALLWQVGRGPSAETKEWTQEGRFIELWQTTEYKKTERKTGI